MPNVLCAANVHSCQKEVEMNKPKITILYERYSVNDDKDKESNSIENQRFLLEQYVEKNNLKPAEEMVIRLSKRQLDMLTYLSKGMTYNEVAEASGLGHGTVKSYILLVYKRLGVRNAQEAVIKARMLGLLK